MFNHTTTSDRAIIETLEQSQEKGFRMLLAKYQEPVYWHIRRLVVSHSHKRGIAHHRIGAHHVGAHAASTGKREAAHITRTTRRETGTAHSPRPCT